jgi:hypothetical protein
MKKLGAAMLASLLCTAANAQSAANAGSAGLVEPEAPPVQCWLKSAKAAVHVGEHFNVTLTCSVLDTPRLAAVPDLAQIEPATIQFPPYEVMGGMRHADVRSGTRRYLQFEYTLRVIADGFFGRDLPIPPVTLKYNLSVNSGGSEQQGRERSYILPSIPVRVLSLVPQLAGDIRDASRSTFADIERRRTRSESAIAAAVVLFVFAAVFLLLAATSSFTRFRGTAAAAPRKLSDGAMLAVCRRVLSRVNKVGPAEGWTPELTAEGLAAVRVGAAIALGRSVAQIVSSVDATPSEGQIAGRMGFFRPRKVLVSAAVTSRSLSTQLDTNVPHVNPRMRPAVEKLRDALDSLSGVRYARGDAPQTSDVSRAMDSAASALLSLRFATLSPIRFIDAITHSARQWSLAWTR